MDEGGARAFVRFPVMMPSATMARFETQMRIDGINPDPKTGRMPFDKSIVALLTAYADGRVAIVAPTKHHHAPSKNPYMEDHT